jgi:Domain of unknown function (DUF4402)
MERLHSIALGTLAAVSLCCGCLHAQSISISVAQNLSFPTIAIPQSGTVALSVSALNSSTSGSATILYGAASRGQYNISTDGQGSAISTSVDITNVSVSDPNVTLTNFNGLYHSMVISEFPSPTLPLPEVSPAYTPLYVGATITAAPGVSPGICTASFVITVTVQ